MADLAITPANVTAETGSSQRTNDYLAGEAVEAGDSVYLDASDTRIKLSLATDAAKDAVSGIALNNAAAEQPVRILQAGDIDLGVALAVGQIYVLSPAAAGGIAPVGDLAAGNYVSIIGIATAADNLHVDINNSGVQKA